MGANGCGDVNECTANTDTCDNSPDACSNFTGGYSCACPSSYTGNGQSSNGCADIDECTLDTDNCNTNATCTNTAGGFTCVCKSGYSGNGVICVSRPGCRR